MKGRGWIFKINYRAISGRTNGTQNKFTCSENEFSYITLTSNGIINGLLSFLDAKFELFLVLSQLISTVIIQESILKLSLGVECFCFLVKALYINQFRLLVIEKLNPHNKQTLLTSKKIALTGLQVIFKSSLRKHRGRMS